MDKMVYFERTWTRCRFVAQTGVVVTVRLQDGLEIDVPFQHVRDVNAECLECGTRLFRNSYQTHSGQAVCSHCYEQLTSDAVILLFGGPQWMSWDGQMNVRDMEDGHLINALGKLKSNALLAKREAGGEIGEYLSPQFGALLDEIRRRRRPEEVKMNSLFLYIWTVILMLRQR